MSIKNILLPEYNFVYTYYCGSIDDMQVRAYTDQLKRELSEFKAYGEIIDFSHDVDFSNLSSAALNIAGSHEKDRPHTRTGPLAILVKDPLTYGLARTYTTFAADFRTEVLISYNFADCISLMGLKDYQRLQVEKAIRQNLSSRGNLSTSAQLEFHFPADH